MSEIWTPVGQFVQDRVRYELDGQLDVAQRRAESHTALYTHVEMIRWKTQEQYIYTW